MALKIKVYSDYVCPYCLLAKKPLDEAIAGKDVEVEWMPYELRPYPNETLKPEGSYLQNVWRDSVYPMAKNMGVPIILPRVSPQPYTQLAFEGYQYAKEQGKGQAYNERMLKAFFQEELNIGNIEVLTRLAEEVGLDAMEYRTALVERKYELAHKKALHHAYNEANISAVPTFIIGNRILRGLHSKETIEQVIAQEMQSSV